MAPKSKEDLASNLAKLSLQTTGLDTPSSSTAPASKPAPKKTKKAASPVADSWEDEADSDSDSDAAATATPIASTTAGCGTSAPPPTPMSPVAHTKRPFSPSALSSAASAPPDFSSLPQFDGPGGYPSSSSSSSGPAKRPEKTDAVARRMIASALGMRAPKQTDEQKAYDRAVREKERKRREEERERERLREEEKERARQAIWDD